MCEQNPSKCRWQRYKGIENFLRRVAFNLGNTPSETEVKIISCIPIDVTDLQQRIFTLERQLNEATRNKSKNQTRKISGLGGDTTVVTRALIDYERQSAVEDITVSEGKTTDEKTASMTEGNVASEANEETVNTTSTEKSKSISKSEDGSRSYENPKSNNPKNTFSDENTRFDEAEEESCQSLGGSTSKGESDHSIKVEETRRADTFVHNPITFEEKVPSRDRFRNENVLKKLKPITENYEIFRDNGLKKIFRRTLRMTPKKKRKNEQLVYYATQSTTSPFHVSPALRNSPETRRDSFSQSSYIKKVMRKQYKPGLLFNCYTPSELSTPICRDINCNTYIRKNESDILSCVYGNFQNIDHYTPKSQYNNVFETAESRLNDNSSNKSCYYDDKFYDVVPVREKAKTKTPEADKLNKDEVFEHMEMLCWPEVKRPKFQPFIVNYHTLSPAIIKHLNKTEKMLKSMKGNSKHFQSIYEKPKSSDSCLVECGDLYKKQRFPGIKLQKIARSELANKKSPTRTNKNQYMKNDKPNQNNNSVCQTNTSTQVVQQVKESYQTDKTEETLNQIKTILQSVLTEVKSSSKHNPKKDAVVQKGISQNEMQGCASFLNSHSYGPYDFDPYVASGQRQMTASYFNPYCYPMSFQPMKCSQNFPLIVQATPRPFCTTCFKKPSTATPNYVTPKKIISVCTNTETGTKEKCSTETQHLIKEIYKSLNMEIPSIDISCSDKERFSANINDFNDNRQTLKRNIILSNVKTTEQRDPCNSPLVTCPTVQPRANMVTTTTETDETSNGKPMFCYQRSQEYKKENSTVDFTESEPLTKDDIAEATSSEEEVQSDVADLSESEDSDKTVVQDTRRQNVTKKREATVPRAQIPKKVREKRDAYVQQQQTVPKKQNMFRKVFKTVFKIKNKTEDPQTSKQQVHDASTLESDSDDYETIYSQKICRKNGRAPQPQVYHQKPTITYSKARHSLHSQPCGRRPSERPSTRIETPRRLHHYQHRPHRSCLEQEFRRQWLEKMLYEREQAKWTGHPFARSYETRTAMVHHDHPLVGDAADHHHVAVAPSPVEPETTKRSALGWLKKHKPNIKCAPQWKKVILES